MQFDINDINDDSGCTALFYCCMNGMLGCAKTIIKLYDKFVDIEKSDFNGKSPLMIACEMNRFETVEWLINDEFCRKKINVNSQDKNGMTPLMIAVSKSNVATVKCLLKCNDSRKISLDFDSKNKKNKTLLDCAANSGDVSIFGSIMLALFNKNKIKDCDALIQSKILDINTVNKWLEVCKQNSNSALSAFLTQLIENGLLPNDFGYIEAMVLFSGKKDESDVNNIINDYNTARFANAQSHFLASKLKQHTLSDIFNVVMNEGVLNQNCGFSDNLLYLCQKIDGKQFYEKLNETTRDCLSQKSKNSAKYNWFKNNLLYSTVWSLRGADTSGSSNYSSNKDEIKSNDNDGYEDKNNDKKGELLFDSINNSFINEELLKQKEYIRNEMIKLEKTFSDEFKQLKSIKEISLGYMNKITQRSVINAYDETTNHMLLNGVTKLESGYKLNELPLDNTNGFDGIREYDINGYLTKLLIESQNIDPFFQKECKEYFNNLQKQHNINCAYCAAPVKTRARAINKASMDYRDREWPTVQVHTYLHTILCHQHLSVAYTHFF